jgi:putative membrane protein
MMKTIASLSLRGLALGMGGLLFTAGLLCAQSAPPDGGTLKRADRNFIEKAAKAGQEEVAISQVALDRSTNSQVKEFAQMMVTDHTMAGDSLAALAAAKQISLPAKEMAEGKWTRKSGKDFDEDYVDKMVSDHEDAVKLFTKEANDGKDTETVEFARKTLPTLQHHLEAAKDLKKTLK